jgi:hypothetical protein
MLTHNQKPYAYWIWPIIIIASTIGVSLVTFGDVKSPIRPLIVMWFLFICPGMAFVRLLQLKEGFAEWTLAIALSFAMDTIVAGGMLYAGAWSPKWSLIVLVFLSLAGAMLQIVTASNRLLDIVRQKIVKMNWRSNTSTTFAIIKDGKKS